MERLIDEVRALWPDAPVAEADPAGRWLSFADRDGRTVYLQRYAWDENCRPHYLLVTARGEGAVEQRRFVDLVEAIGPLKPSLENPPAPARAA
jgi:hypothetical protein